MINIVFIPTKQKKNTPDEVKLDLSKMLVQEVWQRQTGILGN